MKLVLVRLGLLVLSVASFGCSGNDEEEFEFGQADMEEALFGTWTGTLTASGGNAVPLTLEIRSHDDVARSTACASRNFSGESSTPGLEQQCFVSTSLQVSATLVAGDDASPTEFDGYFMVAGTTFSGGELSLYGRSSDGDRIWTRLDGGTWTPCEIWNGPENLGNCTLDARVGD